MSELSYVFVDIPFQSASLCLDGFCFQMYINKSTLVQRRDASCAACVRLDSVSVTGF